MIRKRIGSLALILAMSAGTILGDAGSYNVISDAKAKSITEEVTVDASQINADSYGLADNIQDGVILHCFDWKYNQIKEELPAIAEAGFTSVQTSPAQPGCGSGVWYNLYQPLGFWVSGNDLGSREELQALCEEADKYGIKVVVDVVANHLAGDHSNIDGDLKGGDCWHSFGPNIDYHSDAGRIGIHHGEIGMPDLNSENTKVQEKVRSYIMDLKSLGVDGIRWDAAKHIGLPSEDCNFWPAVTDTGLYNYGEILCGPMDSQTELCKKLMKEYTEYLSVTDSSYGDRAADRFKNGTIPEESGYWTSMGVDADKLVYWGESHDTYSNNGGSSKNISQNAIDRAYAVGAARADATALYFSRPASKDKESIMAGQKGSTHYTSKEVAEVNKFHNAMIGEKDSYVADKNSNCVAICRETGAVLVKGSGGGVVSVENGEGLTEPGEYIDQVSGGTFTVTDNKITGTVGETGIAVLYDPSGATLKTAKVTVSKPSGGFSEPFDLTLTAKNATKASYEVSTGESGEITKTKTISVGKNAKVGDKITVKVTAIGEEGTTDFSETYTYTYEEKTYKLYLRVSKEEFSSAPYIYLYGGEDNNMEWPGTAMKAAGDYWVYATDDTNGGTAIFNDGTDTWQYPEHGENGLEVSGYMEFSNADSKLKTIKPEDTREEIVTSPTPVVTETARPTENVKGTETPILDITASPSVVPSDSATEVPVKTTEPTKQSTPVPASTAKPRVTNTPVAQKEDGTSQESEKNEPVSNLNKTEVATSTPKVTATPVVTTPPQNQIANTQPTAQPVVITDSQVVANNPAAILTITSCKASKTVVKRGKKVTVKTVATGESALKYSYKVKKSGSSKVIAQRAASTKNSYSWSSKKKGTYKIMVTVTDSAGNSKSKTIKINVK